MLHAFGLRAGEWQDVAAGALAVGSIGGFLAAMEVALARLVFLASF